MTEKKEELKIYRKGKATHIKGGVLGFEFLDKESDSIVVYVPSLDISGYGKTVEDAREMVRFCIDSYMTDLSKLPLKEIHHELFKLGWSKQKFHTKILSPNFVPLNKLEEQGIKDYKELEIPFAA